MNRRNFLKSISLSALTALLPQFVSANSIGSAGGRKLVVLIELKGGNDGLNTLVPYSDQAYYSARPKIAIGPTEVHKLSGQLGLHPALEPLLPSWNAGELGWVQGLGYPEPNRSHFESIEIWDTARSENSGFANGWAADCFADHKLGGIAIDTNLGPLYGEGVSSLSISDPYRFVDRGQQIRSLHSNDLSNNSLRHIVDVQSQVDMMADTLAAYLADVPKPKQAFANNSFGRSLNSLYTLIASGINVPVYKVSLGGFDTHLQQPYRQQNLFTILASGVAALRVNLIHVGMWDEVVVMTYSEFGRRVKENSGKGTDHGTAAPHMILGGKVKGGIYGKQPSLTDLDERGDMFYTTDFRDMYETIRRDWWGLNPLESRQSLGFV